ncbi:hypothetical protein Leryth_015001 [Lithospermum erythrorhizon]|nr:hypothetical protein Leryth_015001 [Lithospermum erythrorhizon]
MVAQELKKNSGSPKLELGEIDTSSPFQSVKDAINLFREDVSSGEKSSVKKKDYLAETVFAKETQLHLAQEELNKLKEQLENAESLKSQAHAELYRAKITVDELVHKLKVVGESKDFAIKETEEAKNQVMLIQQGNHCITRSIDESLKDWLEAEREKYSVAIRKLDSVKQLLRSVHQEYDASLAGMITAINQAAEAELAAKVENVLVDELSRKIATLQESISQLKRETVQIQGEEAQIHNQKHIQHQLFYANLEESANKLDALRKNFDPKLSENLEIQLASTVSEIVVLQNQIDYAKTSDLDSLKVVTSEVDVAKELLHKAAEEELSMLSLVESLNVEMENVKKEQSQLKEMETEMESNAENMSIKMQKAKLELEEALNDEVKVKSASEVMISTLYKLVLDIENAKHEVEEIIKQVEELKKESASTMILVEEAEKKLATALEEAEEVRTTELSALEEIKRLSAETDASGTSSSQSAGHISIPREEFETLNRRVEESDELAEIKVAAAMAEVEAVKASENEALKKLESMQKEIDEMKAMTHEALKKTEMDEAARKAVHRELIKWREREQKVVETASRMPTESEMFTTSSRQNYHIQKMYQSTKKAEVRKLEKARTSMTMTKKVIKPNLSHIFNKKRNKVEGGSLSYLPGEMPV